MKKTKKRNDNGHWRKLSAEWMICPNCCRNSSKEKYTVIGTCEFCGFVDEGMLHTLVHPGEGLTGEFVNAKGFMKGMGNHVRRKKTGTICPDNSDGNGQVLVREELCTS